MARYETHGGYTFAAVTSDGELLCVPCLRKEFRQVFRATSDQTDRSGWRVVGLAHSGDSEQTEHCADCGKPVWEHDSAPDADTYPE